MAHDNRMAILQEVDKCVRCNGCVISCKRTWHMKGLIPSDDLPNRKLTFNQRVVIKSQGRVDSGPFVRFSCWHCDNPPCAGRCPFKAIWKDAVSGAVYINPTLCKPEDPKCTHQCKNDCQKGGIPMIGPGSDLYGLDKAWKCTMCVGVGANGVQFGPWKGAGYPNGAEGDLPTKAPGIAGWRISQLPGSDPSKVVDELDHQPTCVFTCPAKAMVYDTKENIERYVSGNGFVSVVRSSGQMYWASKKGLISPPKADPFMEDHVAPLLSGMLSSPFAKAALAPTLVVSGLLALSARRAKIEEEALSASGEVR